MTSVFFGCDDDVVDVDLSETVETSDSVDVFSLALPSASFECSSKFFLFSF